MKSALLKSALALAACALAAPAFAQMTPASPPSDLTLGNFFSEGWTDGYVKRQTMDGTPDMALLRVTTNFLESEFRTDFTQEQDVNSGKQKTIDVLDALIAYPIDRRLMLSVTSNYEWIDLRNGQTIDGSSVAATARVQLVDVAGSSYAFNLKVQSPNQGVGTGRSTVAYGLAGWQDLTPVGLDGVGLYFSVIPEAFIGPRDPGEKKNDVVYDVSLAKTWTDKSAPLGYFTTFAELFSQTNLDGDDSGTTVLTFTPGIRTLLSKKQVLMVGVDLPVSHPHPESALLRATYIINF